MATMIVAQRHPRALVRRLLAGTLLAAAAAGPRPALAQNAAAAMECATVQRPRLAELTQAAAAARKSSNLVMAVRLRHLETQVMAQGPGLAAVQNAGDCQRVATQIDGLREQLLRLSPEARPWLAGAPAPQPAAAVPQPAGAAAPAVADDTLGCVPGGDPTLCSTDEQRQAAETTGQLLPASPLAPAAPAPARAAQPAPGATPDHAAAAECQQRNQRELAALESEVHSLQATTNASPKAVAVQNQQLAEWHAKVNQPMAVGPCDQVGYALRLARSNVRQGMQNAPAKAQACAKGKVQKGCPGA